MEAWQKITAGALVGGVVIGGVILLPKLVQLGKAAPQMDVIPKAMIHKFDPLSGLTIRIDVQLKNPTPAAFKMKYPYVRVTAGDSLLGTSQAVNKDIGMPGYGEANISAIMLQIPMLKLLSLAGTFLKAVSANQEVKINIATVTHIDPYWTYNEEKKEWKRMLSLGKKSMVPYTNDQPVTLRKKA